LEDEAKHPLNTTSSSARRMKSSGRPSLTVSVTLLVVRPGDRFLACASRCGDIEAYPALYLAMVADHVPESNTFLSLSVSLHVPCVRAVPSAERTAL
jgi:hypothetical protein